MQINESNKIIFTIETYQPKNSDKWVGVVVDGIGEPIVHGNERTTPEKAVRTARRALLKALSCEHDMEWEDYGMIGQDQMGNDLYGHSGRCKKCNFLDNVEVEDD